MRLPNANVAYGHRDEVGLRVWAVTLEEMRGDTERWYKALAILNNPRKLKARFEQSPTDARPYDVLAFASDAHFHNTLQVGQDGQI